MDLLEQFQINKIPILDRGCELREDIVRYFVEKTLEIAGKLAKLFRSNMSIIMTEEEEEEHNIKCEKFQLCKTEKNQKVADHNHLSGLY